MPEIIDLLDAAALDPIRQDLTEAVATSAAQATLAAVAAAGVLVKPTRAERPSAPAAGTAVLVLEDLSVHVYAPSDPDADASGYTTPGGAVETGFSAEARMEATAGGDSAHVEAAGGLVSRAALSAALSAERERPAEGLHALLARWWAEHLSGQYATTSALSWQANGGAAAVPVPTKVGWMTGIGRFSFDSGATWQTPGGGNVTFNETLQTATFSPAPPAGTNTVRVEGAGYAYTGIGAAGERYEVLASSPHLFVTTSGAGANATSDDYAPLMGAAGAIASRMPANEYFIYLSTGGLRLDRWLTRQLLRTAPDVPQSYTTNERQLVAVPVAAVAGESAVVVRVTLVAPTTTATATRGMHLANVATGTTLRAVAAPLYPPLTATYPYTWARLVMWPHLVRRERDGRLLLMVVTDLQRGSFADSAAAAAGIPTATVAASNTAAVDVFAPFGPALYL